VRILLVHNYYRSGVPSGENRAFELERALLRENGHEVESLVRRSDELGGPLGAVRGALAVPWNVWTPWRVRRAVAAFRPDVVHVHNTFPLLSPSVFAAVGRRAARVLTLHNYRLFCPAAIPLRDGATCTDCLDRRSAWPAVRHGCYRGSRLATLPVAAGVGLHRLLRTWERQVDAFVALTDFQRDLMVRAGLPAARVWVKPNFFPGAPERLPWAARSEAVVFVGRLSEEKGLLHLVRAWTTWGDAAPELRIVGDGPLRGALEAGLARGEAPRVRVLGQLPPEAAQREVARARLLVLPSVWFEGFPLVVTEAFALATPVAVSRVGALPRMVRGGACGPVFEPGDAASLLAAVRAAWEGGGLQRASEAAAREYQSEYTPEENHRQLLRLYQHALDERGRSG
jgi:glycosyltransferase involved in cell wall biosynthesis